MYSINLNVYWRHSSTGYITRTPLAFNAREQMYLLTYLLYYLITGTALNSALHTNLTNGEFSQF